MTSASRWATLARLRTGASIEGVARVSERVAVIIPARDEEATIGAVVRAFAAALPHALIVVADNASRDRTAAAATEAGASVIHESTAGKGRAVRRLFADVEASCYVLVDGDGTYDAMRAPELVASILAGDADMVIGVREEAGVDGRTFRPGHRSGNRFVTWMFARLFDLPLSDALSGYRSFSERFVRTFPVDSRGFEIEIEMDVHAAMLRVPVLEVPTAYRERPEGSESKLRTYRDGIRILRRNLRLFRDASPILAFSILAAPWAMVSFWLVGVAVVEYVETGSVARFPSLIAGVGAFVLAAQLWIAGIILERVARARREVVRLAYLAQPSPWNRTR